MATSGEGAWPLPGLNPQPITFDQYIELTPERLELISGYLIDPPDELDGRLKLLALLLTNVGLKKALQLAPRQVWEKALQESGSG